MGIVVARFTDRWGGVSAAPYDTLNLGDHVGRRPGSVAANRATAGSPGRGRSRVAWMDQVHGDRVVVVDDVPDAGRAGADVRRPGDRAHPAWRSGSWSPTACRS